MKTSSYQRLQERINDANFESFILLRMLAEARGIDTQSGAAWVALIKEVDQRKDAA